MKLVSELLLTTWDIWRNFTTPTTIPFHILSLASMTGQDFGGMQLLKQSP